MALAEPRGGAEGEDDMRRLTAFAAVFLALAALTAPATETRAEPARFNIDPAHQSVGFFVMHVGYQRQFGIFREVEGHFVFDEATNTLSELEVVVQTESVWTNHDARDKHLRSGDFLDSKAFPEMRFTMTEAKALTDSTGTVTGELTLRGETRPLTLDVTLNKVAEYPFGGGAFSAKPYVAGISAKGMIRRSDFGMTYALDGDLVGDEVELFAEIEAIRQE